MADSSEQLFSEFPPVTTEEWLAKITADLKGADFEKKLIWKTNEGINIKPFYRSEDLDGLLITDSLPGEYPFVRGTKNKNEWFIRQEISVTDPVKANLKALEILQKGINSLCFVLPSDALSSTLFDSLLKGIQLDAIEINFKTCRKQSVKLAKLFGEYIQQNQIDPASVAGTIYYDPFKGMLINGKETDGSLDQTIKELVDATASLPGLKVLAANPYLFNNAGANCAQELGFGLAYANEYLNRGTDAGLSAKTIAKKISFSFGVGSNYFMEIAKFRAARLLWAQIVNAYLPKEACKCAAKMYIHATTSEWNQSIYDAYVNLLRGQTAAMSATIAGVDALTVTPFDKSYKTSDTFSERIARNQQLLLKEETHIDKVVDPAAGSYYIENLTNSLAGEAWKIFLDVEEKGGFLASIQEGFIQQEINKTNEKRHLAISSRREVLLGTNQYPNFNEQALDKIDPVLIEPACDCSATVILPLNFSRAGSDFETLRLATERSGKRPKVFMLTIGNLNMRLARAQFSSNFFGCAGYEIIDNLGFKTPEEGVKAARAVKADIVVICSSDEEYAELAPKAYEALKDGKEIFVVAGAPECMETLKAMGITHFINVRTNVLQTLQAFNQINGIN